MPTNVGVDLLQFDEHKLLALNDNPLLQPHKPFSVVLGVYLNLL